MVDEASKLDYSRGILLKNNQAGGSGPPANGPVKYRIVGGIPGPGIGDAASVGCRRAKTTKSGEGLQGEIGRAHV